jgi:hypothetical protein
MFSQDELANLRFGMAEVPQPGGPLVCFLYEVQLQSYLNIHEIARACRQRRCPVCTDLNSLCYNSLTGQGQLLWVHVACRTVFGQRFRLVSMVSINLGIRFYGG